MKRTQLEQYIAIFLFIAVLLFFSYAEEESKKIRKLYTKETPAKETRLALKPAHVPNTP